MAPPLLSLQDIHLSFGGTPLLEGAELSIGARERLCLVGRNGSGKSTLLKIAAGLIEPDRGQRFLQPGTTLRYLPQEPDFSGFATSLDYVTAGLGPSGEIHRAAYFLDHLGLTGKEDPARLSGGEARRAALARALAPEPDILLLDEPTNHLDLPAIEWLEEELTSLPSALVLISHDRRFLESLSTATTWLDRGITRHLPRGFKHFEAWRDDTLSQEDREAHKLGRKIEKEEDWLRYGVTARRKRNVKRLEQLHALRTERIDTKNEQARAKSKVRMSTNESATSGKLVIEADHISKSYGERVIIRDLSLKVRRGDRIGIVGANGTGKTTLLNLLTGTDTPDAGAVRLGTNLHMITLDQRRESLDPAMTLRDTLTGGGGDMVAVSQGQKHVIGYMKDFLFQPEQARTPIRELSGGERGRLMLARALAKPSNLLVLDEPTNDLDLETLDLLQEMLADYAGTVLLVSHDRDFLDRCVTSTLYSAGGGGWTEYAGGYTDMLAQQNLHVGAENTTPVAKKETALKQDLTAPVSPRPNRKLSFKEKHALETLPKKISIQEREIRLLRKTFADPDLFTRDPEAFQKAADSLARGETDLAAMEEEWLNLEILREELKNPHG